MTHAKLRQLVPHVLVVDDNPRFAVSVWRILAGAQEFGYVRERETDEGSLRRRVAPDSSFAFEWYDPTRPHELERFRARCAELATEVARAPAKVKVWALVDVRYPARIATAEHGEFADVFEAKLRERGELWIMSSYRRPPKSEAQDIRAKSLENVMALREAVAAVASELRDEVLRGAGSAGTAGDSECAHVLITGAGFEIPDGPHAIGVPPTHKLLMDMELPEGKRMMTSTGCHLPLPYPAFDTHLEHLMLEACKENDLDRYWDLLLEGVQAAHLARRSATPDNPALRKEWKAAASVELRLRDAFRRSIAKYDLGHLGQCSGAAEVDWDVWLTTNYTRFIDRALEPNQPCAGRRRWRVLKTVGEAEVYQSSQLVRGPSTPWEPIAIKLHGDIGQVYTMALALRDKESFTPFYVRPALHAMYSAGVSSIVERLMQPGVRSCRWHIVGHGLADMPLTTLIRRVVEQTSGIGHTFALVSPGPQRPACIKRLKTCLQVGGGTPLSVKRYMWYDLTASSYVAHIQRFGLQGVTSEGLLDFERIEELS